MKSNARSRRVLILAITALMPFAAAACGDDDGDDDDDDDDDQSRLRIIHASPDAPPVDVYLEDEDQAIITDLAYGETSEYVDVDEGTFTLQLRAAGAEPGGEFLFETEEIDLAKDEQLTAVAAGTLESTGENDKFRVLALHENFQELEANTAVVRFVHASPDADTLAFDVGDDGDIEVEGINAFDDSGEAGIEIPIGAGDTRIAVRQDNERITAFTVPALSEGDQMFVVATGLLTTRLPREATGFALITADDADTSELVRQDPTLFVLHASPDAPALQVREPGEDATLEPIAFAELTSLQVSPGREQLEVLVNGASEATSLAIPETVAGERYLVVVTGFAGEGRTPGLATIVAQEQFELGDTENARLVVIHASPDAPEVDISTVAGITLEDPVLIEGLAFSETTRATGIVVPPGTVTIGVAPAGEPTAVATFTIPLAADLRAFGVAAGALAPTADDEPLTLIAVLTGDRSTLAEWAAVPIEAN